MKFAFLVTDTEGKSNIIKLKGRNVWALKEFVWADARGRTSIENPAPRWSAYVFNPRREYALEVETLNEPHKGAFPGTHARYVLKSQVSIAAGMGELEDTCEAAI